MPIALCARYAVSGTDVAYGAAYVYRATPQNQRQETAFSVQIVPGMRVCACYAVSGTDVAYGATTRHRAEDLEALLLREWQRGPSNAALHEGSPPLREEPWRQQAQWLRESHVTPLRAFEEQRERARERAREGGRGVSHVTQQVMDIAKRWGLMDPPNPLPSALGGGSGSDREGGSGRGGGRTDPLQHPPLPRTNLQAEPPLHPAVPNRPTRGGSRQEGPGSATRPDPATPVRDPPSAVRESDPPLRVPPPSSSLSVPPSSSPSVEAAAALLAARAEERGRGAGGTGRERERERERE
eukprot:841483-Rhodomonas_salina.1